MDIGGDCGIVLVVMMIVTAVARVAALIRINLSFVVVFVVILMVFVLRLDVVVVMVIVIMGTFSFPPPLLPLQQKYQQPPQHCIQNTHRYGTFGDGGSSGIGWVLMLVVVMVGFCWS